MVILVMLLQLLNVMSGFQVPLRGWQIRMEKVEKKVLRLGTSITIHFRHVQLQRETLRTDRNDAIGRIHSGLYRGE